MSFKFVNSLGIFSLYGFLIRCQTIVSELQVVKFDSWISSFRFIVLDPSGYVLIKVDHSAEELVLEHCGNTIDEKVLERDDETGEIFSCKGGNGPRRSVGSHGQGAGHSARRSSAEYQFLCQGNDFDDPAPYP